MKVLKQIDIYVSNKRNVRPIHVVQSDTGVQLVFTVKDFTIPSGTTAKLYVQKPSGKFVYQTKNITISGNTITIDLENQAITEHGQIPYQVSLTNGSDEITTFAGMMMVEMSLKNGATESKTVIHAFDELTAEKVAEFRANAERIAADVIATIPDEYTETTEKVNTLFNSMANAIKGNLSGPVVFADDVSPVEHDPIVKVRSKNLLLYPYADSNKTENGITFTDNGDGTVFVSGTATGTAYFICHGTDYDNQKPIPKGVYTVSGAAQNVRVVCGVRSSRSGERILYNATDGTPSTFVVDTDTARFDFIIAVDAGNSVSGVIVKPVLNKGEMPVEYSRYIDPSTVTVRRCGKNIFGVAAKSQTQNGVTFTVNDDGSVTANGTATKATFIGLGSLVLKPDEKYRLSGSPDGSGFDTYLLYIHNNTTGADTYDLGDGKAFTGKDGDLGVTIAVYAGNTVNNLIFRPMVVYGEESGEFEPYNATTHTPDADGTVDGVTSLSPNMTILTDTEGVIVECEYNRDTNKVIQSLVNAITALGGTV